MVDREDVQHTVESGEGPAAPGLSGGGPEVPRGTAEADTPKGVQRRNRESGQRRAGSGQGVVDDTVEDLETGQRMSVSPASGIVQIPRTSPSGNT